MPCSDSIVQKQKMNKSGGMDRNKYMNNSITLCIVSKYMNKSITLCIVSLYPHTTLINNSIIPCIVSLYLQTTLIIPFLVTLFLERCHILSCTSHALSPWFYSRIRQGRHFREDVG